MALSREDVADIADYARIALTDAELDEMTTYLNEAVGLLEPIREYDLAGVEPTFHPIGDLSNVMADDVPDTTERALPLDVALSNAGSTRDRSFRVPSILGAEGGDR
ncbi:Asp-tRNA(Asn)/Glu-tRNA(Gln) amidotransferase subunit GatC [Thermophilibacter immobilis]|jgi:aspartyl-tRNA(Asn)/glutamyl-tRNA(Gln) amidotransferase subunit C|uniref:Aspartyl/glutamyl-tRNA(Asn/Gln) amidotransferase subunit C n=1 Tax=Thermophilibacter immobilis TaxID=2779519 RepID=A0A7S7M7P6_9ACTN|nr:Asp-tRNA(Asn)/Glu-tRNA(Gln) amidotransferase subunit GatC [Thermophilibacter immobilis]QOY60275.1 Asp-tRNA(Asn)/Glu-tRNA(Gln) amidotransferase subunit GatC [Thermophilibacter immobilis]